MSISVIIIEKSYSIRWISSEITCYCEPLFSDIRPETCIGIFNFILTDCVLCGVFQ